LSKLTPVPAQSPIDTPLHSPLDSPLNSPLDSPLDSPLENPLDTAKPDPCAHLCDLKLAPPPHNEGDHEAAHAAARSAICSKASMRKMLACAKCIDDTWSYENPQDSAVYELGNLLIACELGEVSCHEPWREVADC